MVDLGFGDDFFEQDRSWDDLGRPFQGFMAPTKILYGPGYWFYRWFLDLMTNYINFEQKSLKNH